MRSIVQLESIVHTDHKKSGKSLKINGQLNVAFQKQLKDSKKKMVLKVGKSSKRQASLRRLRSADKLPEFGPWKQFPNKNQDNTAIAQQSSATLHKKENAFN